MWRFDVLVTAKPLLLVALIAILGVTVHVKVEPGRNPYEDA